MNCSGTRSGAEIGFGGRSARDVRFHRLPSCSKKKSGLARFRAGLSARLIEARVVLGEKFDPLFELDACRSAPRMWVGRRLGGSATPGEDSWMNTG